MKENKEGNSKRKRPATSKGKEEAPSNSAVDGVPKAKKWTNRK
jgi:hypothetical protein